MPAVCGAGRQIKARFPAEITAQLRRVPKHSFAVQPEQIRCVGLHKRNIGQFPFQKGADDPAVFSQIVLEIVQPFLSLCKCGNRRVNGKCIRFRHLIAV